MNHVPITLAILFLCCSASDPGSRIIIIIVIVNATSSKDILHNFAPKAQLSQNYPCPSRKSSQEVEKMGNPNWKIWSAFALLGSGQQAPRKSVIWRDYSISFPPPADWLNFLCWLGEGGSDTFLQQNGFVCV